MNFRSEQDEDRAAIRAVHVASFPTEDEADLVDELREAGRLLVSLVAQGEGQVLGHVAFSPVTLPGSGNGVGLGPVAVLPEYRWRGIGAGLIRRGLELCAQMGIGFAVVLGDPQYYQRFGFRPASQYGLEDEFGGGDAFQALELRPGGIPRGGGLVRYAPEFQQLED